jgi:NAD-dependent dihydropyrimidine dehydrogenase PreA subunit
MIRINKRKCYGCGVCVESCPFGVLAIKAKKAVIIKPEACHDCQVCIKVCPNKAIKYVIKQSR